MKNLYFILAACVWMIQSCTIQKRQHLPGYHIEWNSQHSRSEARVSKEKEAAPSQIEHVQLANTPEIQQQQPSAAHAEVLEKSTAVENKNLSSRATKEIKKKSGNSRKPSLNFPLALHSPATLLFGSKSSDGERKTDGLSIAAMICGILSFFVPVVGIVLAILAIVFGGIGMGRTKRDPELKGRGMAITGLVLGIIGMLFVVLVLAILSLSFGFAI